VYQQPAVGTQVLVESFPLSAWRALALPYLPAKANCKATTIVAHLDLLRERFPLRVEAQPNHDQLQAIAAGLAGLALERNAWDELEVSGQAPTFEDGLWREGYILNWLHALRR